MKRLEKDDGRKLLRMDSFIIGAQKKKRLYKCIIK